MITNATAPVSKNQFEDFYEVDLSDEEDRKDKKSVMQMRRKQRRKTENN